MTNPGDAVGTNGAYGGRTSVNAFNDVLSAFSVAGIISGWKCVPKTGLTVSLGGQELIRDVAIAENDIGQRTTVNNISAQPIDVTLSAAPALGSRYDVLVAYVNNPPDSNAALVDNPDACGLIAVEGSVATNPSVPTESMIRDAITADGASGVSAYFVVLAQIKVNTGATVITNTDITLGASATVAADIPPRSITGEQIAFQGIKAVNLDYTSTNAYSRNEHSIGAWIDGQYLFRRVLTGTIPSTGNSVDIPFMINPVHMVKMIGVVKEANGDTFSIPSSNPSTGVYISPAYSESGKWVSLSYNSYFRGKSFILICYYYD